MLFGLADLGAGLDAEGLGLVAGGDAAGGVGHGGDDGERAVAVFGVELLLDRRKEAVEVDVEEARSGRIERGSSWRELYSPAVRCEGRAGQGWGLRLVSTMEGPSRETGWVTLTLKTK